MVGVDVDDLLGVGDGLCGTVEFRPQSAENFIRGAVDQRLMAAARRTSSW